MRDWLSLHGLDLGNVSDALAACREGAVPVSPFVMTPDAGDSGTQPTGAVQGDVREVARDFTHNLFPDAAATSLRRNMDKSVRRINRWTGANMRRAGRGVLAVF